MRTSTWLKVAVTWRMAVVLAAAMVIIVLLVVERDPNARLVEAPLGATSLAATSKSTTTTATTTTTAVAPLSSTNLTGPRLPSTASCVAQSVISSNFNGTGIASGSAVWFNAIGTFGNVPTNTTTTIYVINQSASFSSGGKVYTAPLPDATIVFSNTVTAASTSFAGNMWTTTVPASYKGNVFIGGGLFPVPVGGLPGGVKPVGWSMTFNLAPGVNVAGWKWASAVYKTYTTNATAGAKPVDGSSVQSSYKNSDHAGTPEAFKSSVVGGAMGGGGSNFTGSYSGTANVPCTP